MQDEPADDSQKNELPLNCDDKLRSTVCVFNSVADTNATKE